MRLPFAVKRFLSEMFLRLCLIYVKFQLRGNKAKRSFERVCIVAALNHRNGIVQGAYLQYACFLRLGIDVELLDASAAHHNPFARIKHKPATTYIFHSGGPQIATLLASVLPAAKDAYRIAYWAWELPGPPKEWPDPEGLVSEIWTCSQFARRSLSMRYKVPVGVCHHAVTPSAVVRVAPSRFTVLVLADSRSSFVRKNAIAGVKAFQMAFGNNPAAKLVVKLNGNPRNLLDQLKDLTSTNVEIIDKFLDDAGMTDLFRSSSVLLSLHRAEGFGLPMLEAMACGIPVVATNWSGNMDFMNEQNSLLIASKQIPVVDTVYSNYSDLTWADPDLDQAAQALRLLQSDNELYKRVADHGRKTATSLLRSWQVPDVDAGCSQPAPAALSEVNQSF